MKRIIDTIALYIVLSAAAFLLFLYAWRQVTSALIFSITVFLALLNIVPTITGFFSKKRAQKAQSAAGTDRMMNQLLYGPYDEAFGAAKAAVLKSYGYEDDHPMGGEGVHFLLFQRHPDGASVSADDIARLYRENRQYNALIIMATCAYEEKARRAAKALIKPRFVLFDGNQMRAMFRKLNIEGAPGESGDAIVKKSRLPITVSPKIAKTAGIYGILNLVLYFALGILAYLLAALFLLGIAVLSHRKPRQPDKLI